MSSREWEDPGEQSYPGAEAAAAERARQMDAIEIRLEWRTVPPRDSGYYLGAWRDGPHWMVSELWFNPSSGWWSSRGYFQQTHGPGDSIRPIDVAAWAPMPVYQPLEETP